jgi:hypothetical protein
VSEASILWLTQEREKGAPITEPLLEGKTPNFHKVHNGEPDFKTSTDWIHRLGGGGDREAYEGKHLYILSADSG